MSEEKPIETEFDLPLLHPITYAHAGSTQEASFVRLRAPSSKHRRECAVLKQAFLRAMKEAPSMVQDTTGKAPEASERDEGEDVTISGSEVLAMLGFASSVDYGEVLEVAARLLTGGVAFIDGEEKLTKAKLDEMSFEDSERLAGEYIARFFAGSALRTLNEGPSAPS